MMTIPLIETVGLNKFFKTPGGMLHAVENINLKIPAHKTLGVVGESGCGKSTLGRAILRLTPVTSGQVFFEGNNILHYGKSDMKQVYRDMQMIFQDPYSSLNPRMTIYNLISEPVRELYGGSMSRTEMADRVHQIMELCGLPRRYANSYPHEMDGGRRQRVGLARAMVIDPKFIICDEPVSALDVSVQAQILNLLMDLQEQHGLSYMFITHDLCVVRHISDDIMVMYMGQAVECAGKNELFANPLHPYTKALLSAIPTTSLSRRNRIRYMPKGEVSSPVNPAPGCRFAPRCPYASEKCKAEYQLREVGPNHYVACHMFD